MSKKKNQGVMIYSLMTIVNYTLLHIGKLLHEQILEALITRKNVQCMYGDRC